MKFQCHFCNFIVDTKRNPPKVGEGRMPCPNCGHIITVPRNSRDEGCVISDFVLLRKIGEGSIGAVFEANQISLNRSVALKVLSEEYTNHKGAADFLREARAVAELNHPNLVQCYAVGEDQGICYMAMSYIKGESAKTKLRREGKIAVDESLHVAQQVAEALYYAWDEKKIVHRDIKPDNIMLPEDGIVKLTDLGLAMHSHEWKKGMDISGSPSYMSPEQFSGKKLDTRTDIYSLGVTLYQMLAGQLPFLGEDVKEIAKQHFEEYPEPLNRIDSKIPQRVATLVEKMMEKSPSNRYRDMESLLNDIWLIRQKTAPDRNLVPDIHTISIKRLGYGQQKEIAKRVEKETKQRLNLLIKVAVVGVPLLLLALVAWLSIRHKRVSWERNLETRVVAVENSLGEDEGTLLPRTLLADIDSLGKQVRSAPISREIRGHLQTRLRLCRTLIEKAQVDAVRGALTTDLESAKLQIEELRGEVEMLRLGQAATESERISRMNTTEADNARLSRELRETRQTLANSEAAAKRVQVEIEELRAEHAQSFRRTVRLDVYLRIREADFVGAVVELRERLRQPGQPQTEWLEEKIRETERLGTMHDTLTRSGTALSGTHLDIGRLMMINDGVVNYRDEFGEFRDIHWTKLSVDNALAIASRQFPHSSEEALRSDVALLLGDPFEAARANSEDSERFETCEMIIRNRVNEIRHLAILDSQKARLEGRNFLLMSRGSPIQEELREKLRTIVAEPVRRPDVPLSPR